MKLTKKMMVGAGVVALLTACNPKPAEVADAKPSELDLTSDKAQLGYTIGAQMSGQLSASGFFDEIELDALIAAFKDTAAGKELRLTDEQMQQAQVAFQVKAQEKVNSLATANKAAGVEYMNQKASTEGVVTTDSGLQYEVLREGKGDLPKAESTVKVHYSGTLIDGTEFDSSYGRGAPTEFPVSGVIPGFSEGLQLMKEGSKYRFTIPSDSAYGANAPQSIGPNQVLIFEVELIEVL